ncbi:maleylacetoacetate isomerase [Aliikangiella coralliicola]|uniref:Maleylacetoacetate isomerase n=1 Tax=Aliikangiella coralliicola TaxID=2592383 RepID=A0A545TSR7_9GAMM|nr:maleylacetoacetate isomerase [Aliikangiella coralliicola]TQV80263.1 maleylacetoacetate isomerase [Aliikangiella coralliicola]
MIKLYGYWRSSAAYRVRIALNLKQISYSQEFVHLAKDGGEQHKPEYKSVNPQSLVPALVDDTSATGQTVTIGQSMAILEYLEEKYPSPRLLPGAIEQRALVRQLCQIIACDVHPLDNLRVLKYLQNNLQVGEEAKMEWYHHWIRSAFTAYEQILAQHDFDGPYSIGEELSLADACLIPQIYNANRFNFPMDDFPKLAMINENCLKLERIQNAVPENQPDAV